MNTSRIATSWHMPACCSELVAMLAVLLLSVSTSTGLEDSSHTRVDTDHASCPAERTTTARPSRWIDLTSADFSDFHCVVLPLGSVEQHGPHLPVGTDLMLAEAFASVAASAPGAILLPASPFGASFEHASFPGTIPVSDAPLEGLWDDVLSALPRSGIRSAVLLNAHGGQSLNAELTARRVRFAAPGRPQLLAVVLNLQALLHACAADIARDADPAIRDAWAWEHQFGIHGGLVETALMLHLHPRLVRMDRARRFNPRPRARRTGLEPHSSFVSYGWKAEDITQCGAVGDASLATAKFGRAVFDCAVDIIMRTVYSLAGESPLQPEFSLPWAERVCTSLELKSTDA